MKKIYPILLSLIATRTMAQPVITSEHDSYTGTFTYHHADALTLDDLVPGPSGAAVNWDFSEYVSVGTSNTYVYNCPGNSHCSDFPIANRLSVTGNAADSSYGYSLLSGDQLVTVGGKNMSGATVTSLTTFDDHAIGEKYPITYEQTFDDTWSNSSGPGITETGTQTVTVDAYGTLKTPLGTFPNTLRVKRIKNIITNVPGSPTMTVVSVSYTWIAPEYAGPLLLISFNDITIDGHTTQTRSFTFGNNEIGLSTPDIEADRLVNVYPNPATEMIRLETAEQILKAELRALDGRSVIEQGDKDKMDISGLAPGMYFLQVQLKDGRSLTKKVIKK